MQSFRSEIENPVVEKDILDLAKKIAQFKAGEIHEEKFRSLRLARGVYGQRQQGVQMIRIKLPYGKIQFHQWKRISDISDEYSTGNLHLTTRQDIQIHYVSLDRTPELWAKLEQDDITLREACGNTVRNITASPTSGIDPKELFDVSPHADAAFRYFLRNPICQEMGRKIKMSFSNTDEDTSLAYLHDVGFIPKIVDGKRGFKVVVGGGLGAQPMLAHVAHDEDEVARLKRDMPEQAFAREYLCDFAAAGEDQLISLTDADAAAERKIADGDVIEFPLVVGVDPARFGDDRSVIVLRQGLRMEPPMIYTGIDNMTLASAVANVIEERDPDAVFIDSGAGAGVIDRLRQLGYDVIEVPFGGKATNPNLFVNKRTEMWWSVKEWLEMGGVLPDRTDLVTELSTPTYWYDAVGKRCLESKDDIKKRLQGGGSPDIADALALTFSYPVAKQLPREVRERLIPDKRDYDPYEDMR